MKYDLQNRQFTSVLLATIIISGAALLAWGTHDRASNGQYYEDHTVSVQCADYHLVSPARGPDGTTIYIDRRGDAKEADDICQETLLPHAQRHHDRATIGIIAGLTAIVGSLFATWRTRRVLWPHALLASRPNHNSIRNHPYLNNPTWVGSTTGPAG